MLRVVVLSVALLLSLLTGCASRMPAEPGGGAHTQGAPAGAASGAAGSTATVVLSTPVATGTAGAAGVASGGTAVATTAANPQILRYIGVKSDWPETVAPRVYAGLYTRVELRSTAQSAGVGPTDRGPLRTYDAESHGWFSRLFMDKTQTATAIANVNITHIGGGGQPEGAADKALRVAIPLFSVSHSSGNGAGESWVTSLTMSNIQSPLFLIGPNTVLALTLDADVSSNIKSHMAAEALGAVTRALQIAAPTVPLATKLSQQEVNNTATAIDSAFSSLLSKSITENPVVDRAVSTWTRDAVFHIYGCAPFVRTETGAGGGGNNANCARNADMDGGMNVQVGEWELRLACPRLSVFYPRDVCQQMDSFAPASDKVLDFETRTTRKALYGVVANAVRDSQVLGFQMSSQITIEAFVQTQTWYTDFTGRRAQGKQAVDYDGFCSDAQLGMEKVGLSELDSALVVRAVINHLPQLAPFRAEFAAGKAGEGCLSELREIGI